MSTVTPTLNLVKPATIEQFSLATYNNNLDLVDAESTDRRKMNNGRQYKSSATSDSGSVSSLSVINNIPTFTFKAGREYSVVWDFEFYGSVTNGYFEYSIATCATTDSAVLTTGLTYLNKRKRSVQEGGSSFKDSGRVEGFPTYGVDTTVQIKFLAQLVANSGTTVVCGSASVPTWYIIDDKGDRI